MNDAVSDAPVFDFEGDEVTDFTAQLPAVTLEAAAAYPRGTYINLNVTVRVKSVRIEEDRKGNLVRKHILAMEECAITEVLTPEARRMLMEAAVAAAEADAAAEAAKDYSIAEDQHIDDLYEIEGQTTIDDALAEPDADVQEVPDEAVREVVDVAEDGQLATELNIPRVGDDDDDDEHSWMDDDESEDERVNRDFYLGATV